MDTHGEFLQECQLLGQQEFGRRWKLQLVQEAQTLAAEEVAALRQLHFVLNAKQTMNTIAQHRALAHEKTALAEHLLDLSGLPTDDMHAGDQLAAQQIGQNPRIHLVGLDLRLSYDARLERIGQYDALGG